MSVFISLPFIKMMLVDDVSFVIVQYRLIAHNTSQQAFFPFVARTIEEHFFLCDQAPFFPKCSGQKYLSAISCRDQGAANCDPK